MTSFKGPSNKPILYKLLGYNIPTSPLGNLFRVFIFAREVYIILPFHNPICENGQTILENCSHVSNKKYHVK
jgi:hypothetical protein